MTIVRVGATKKYADNWESIFKKSHAGKTATKKQAAKATAKKKTARPAAKSKSSRRKK